MVFIRLTEEEKKVVLSELGHEEKNSLLLAKSIIQKIAGVYINKAGCHPEMADLYRDVASSLVDLFEAENQNLKKID